MSEPWTSHRVWKVTGLHRFTAAIINSIAATCDEPTGDAALDGLFDTYAANGFSTPDDRPVYYRFLYQLAQRFPGLSMVELGARRGAASLHFLKGGGERVVGVDLQNIHDPEQFRGLNYRAINAPSCSPAAFRALDDGPPDVLLIDTDHTYETTTKEYELWRQHVAPGGLILFDDICATEYGCTRFWTELKGEKLTFLELHPPVWGFGVLLT